MKEEVLKDFQKWKNLNIGKNFSLYDYIFHITNINKLNTDIYFAFIELFWPSFIVYDRYVILSENFSVAKFDGLKRENQKIEFWMNMFIVDPYFNDDEDEKAESLTKSLGEMWQAKLQRDFPDKTFTIEYFSDPEISEYGLTFYQAITP